MKYGEDYHVTNRLYTYKKEHDLASIEILTGNYKDVEFTFGSINVNEDIKNSEATISFDYAVHNDETLEGNKDFEEVLGAIMNSLLHHSIEEAEERYNNERRKENTKTLAE
jgi:hypothetical protein